MTGPSWQELQQFIQIRIPNDTAPKLQFLVLFQRPVSAPRT